MAQAHDTWNAPGVSLQDIEGRIHDDWPLEKLHDRGRSYVNRIFSFFPHVPEPPATGLVVEIGPGVGYIMQAFMERTNGGAVTGLDIAEGMIAQAQARVARDGLDPERYRFVHYDGVKFPFPDRSVDMFYSVAALQHAPKPFAYNIFSEMLRCLKPEGWAVVQLLHWRWAAACGIPFRQEIATQINGTHTHWHHFYDEIELQAVLGECLGAQPTLAHETESIWAAWPGLA